MVEQTDDRCGTCSNCGIDLPENVSYCPGCGRIIETNKTFLKKSVLIGIVIGFIIIGLMVSGGLFQNGGKAEKAPSFIAKDVLTGENHSLSMHRGEWIFLDFSTAWCTTCQQMKPTLERYYLESRPKDMVFLTISNENNIEAYKKFASEKKYSDEANWPHLIDPSSSVYFDYRVQVLPTIYLIGPEGKIRAKSTGFMGYDELINFVKEAKAERSRLPFGL